jgi:hypothetical protein
MFSFTMACWKDEMNRDVHIVYPYLWNCYGKIMLFYDLEDLNILNYIKPFIVNLNISLGCA